MNVGVCRECARAVRADAATCPQCGAARPADAEWKGSGYEWATRATWSGFPVVHVAFGSDARGKPRTARGLIAIGQRAVGGVAIGIVATGFCALGVLALGVISLGVVALGLAAAAGVQAIAPLAVGVTAFGFAAGGVHPIGWKILFSAPR